MTIARKSKVLSFLLMLIVYAFAMTLYYKQTHYIIIEDAKKSIQDSLLTQKAFTKLVSETQRPEINRLKKDGFIPEHYFSPSLLSSSFLTTKLNNYINIEREKVGFKPMYFKYATINPINKKNLANTHEAELFEKFKNKEISQCLEIIDKNNDTYLYYVIAGQEIDKSCLACHGKPENAPKSLIEQYGDKNGFGYKVGELSSIISIKVSLGDIYIENDKHFLIIAILIFILFTALFLVSEMMKSKLENKEKELFQAHSMQIEENKKLKTLKTSLENLYDHVISSQFDMHGNIVSVSDALCRVSGYEREELLGQNFCYFKHEDMSEKTFLDVWKNLKDGKEWNGEVKNKKKNGEVFWVDATVSALKDENQIIYAYESVMRIITEKKALQADLNIDYLTSLLNRRSFESNFYNEKRRAKRDKKYFALVMFDIDFFKRYNDFYGHQKGDKALIEVAHTLKDSFRRPSDKIFRLGGEEFAVIISDDNIYKIVNLVKATCRKLQDKHILHIKSDVNPFLSMSAGVVTIWFDSEYSLNEMYELSDKALYEAKNSGRNRVVHVEL